MNWQHFRAFLWLRWRLLVNQLRRGGAANVVILAILAAFGACFVVALFLTLFLVGLFVLPEAPPAVLLYVWDGLVVAFLASWATGLIVELQRSEVLSLDKFMHLPVSLKGAFLINYLSSLLSLTLAIFLPAMLALSLALVLAKGPAMLLLFPLLAAFLLMVTALTYQFQSWLAALMVNKRRRRTIIVFVTLAFILMCQLPNLVNILQPWNRHQQDDPALALRREQAELDRAHIAKEITDDEYQQRAAEIQRKRKGIEESNSRILQQVEDAIRLVNVVLPIGWLPLGAATAAEGRALPALLGTLGMGLIGSASLWRAYRTTLRLYTGQLSSGKRAPVPAATPPPKAAKAAKPSIPLLERHLPWLSEPASAIALGGFRSLTRAPEAKMLLLTPVILLVIFGAMLLTRSQKLPDIVPPLAAFGTMAMILLTMIQLVGNQFGFDRAGFRVYVLSAAPRRDILLGKNLSVAPLALGLGTVMLAVLQVFQPMRLDHFLAALPQFVTMYLLFCLLANGLSIFAPMPIRPGTLKPINPKGIPILLHIGFMFLFPLVMLPALLPLVAELVLEDLGWVHGVPICLPLSLVECAAVVGAYRLVLPWQGGLLQAREQRILETVTTRAE